MRDVKVMQVFDSLGDFVNPSGDLLFRHFVLPFLKVLKQCPLLHVLQHEINILVVLEERIELQNIGVVHKGLQFDLQN